MRLVDTHCHIDLDAFDEDRAEVFARSSNAGVFDLLVIGFEPDRWKAALELESCAVNIRVAAGIHPNSVKLFSAKMLDQVRAIARDPRVVAIGETGIDLYWNAKPLEEQKEAFAAQIELARELEMPFIIHQRDAENEVLDVLNAFSAPMCGVLHCFTGDTKYAKRILDLGLHIGLGGAVSFKSRTDLHQAAREIPLDRIVLETDSPFMAPSPYRGKRNEPAYVRLIAERLAQLRGVPLEEIAKQTTENAYALFPGLKAS
jgi:TatD DNase family protein